MTGRSSLTTGPARWFRPGHVSHEAALRLFLFPYAGGNAGMYRDWPALFPRDIAVQAVQPPGRLDRRDEPLHTEIDPLVDQLCEAFSAELDHRPYALFGHSMGALVAYRLAVELQQEGLPPPLLLGAAGWSPEGFLMPTVEQVELPSDELVEWIVSLGSLPESIYTDPGLLAITIPPTRADLRICATYQDDGARLPCPVVTYTGDADVLMDRRSAASWASRCPTYLGNRELPGGHFFIYDTALAIATDLSRHLSRLARGTRRHASR